MTLYTLPSDQDRADNDELNRVCEHLEEAIDELVKLEAHVERLSKAALDAIHYLPGGEIKAELRDAYDDTPATSLARRDLIKQAELLEYMGEEVKNMHPKANKDGIAAHLTHVSIRYRQQANQPEKKPCRS